MEWNNVFFILRVQHIPSHSRIPRIYLSFVANLRIAYIARQRWVHLPDTHPDPFGSGHLLGQAFMYLPNEGLEYLPRLREDGAYGMLYHTVVHEGPGQCLVHRHIYIHIYLEVIAMYALLRVHTDGRVDADTVQGYAEHGANLVDRRDKLISICAHLNRVSAE